MIPKNSIHFIILLLTWGLISHQGYGQACLPLPQNEPIVLVKKELYQKHPRQGVSAWVAASYTGPGLERKEMHFTMSTSDTPKETWVRYSKDNGQTWSPLERYPEIISEENEAQIYLDEGCRVYDPSTQCTVGLWLRQTKLAKVYYDQTFYRLLRDQEKDWGPMKQLRYEAGAVFDSSRPLDPDYLNNNRAYTGNNIIKHSNGTLIHAVCIARIPKDAPDPNPDRYSKNGGPADNRHIGSRCFIGTWNPTEKDYDWKPGQTVWVSRSVSSRGLLEPEVAELKDKRVLVIWRGSDTPKTPGRKWFSVSGDGGMTLSPVSELKYDDGSRFYSPSSIHRMIRSGKTGKLYWIGNICPDPPNGNYPRQPLIIAEVDETIPALKRNSVTVIDERKEHESEKLQLSNFSLLENRQTQDFELYLTRLEEIPNDKWTADAYKYTLTLK